MNNPMINFKNNSGARLLGLAAAGLLFVLLSAFTAQAQTSAFTYQGRLTDNSVPAAGTYTMRFRLFSAASAGTQIGSEIQLSVNVTGGVFSVNLDFGSNAFPSGAARFLEIQVGATTLTPRQQLTGAPYAVRSLASNQSDGLSGACNPCVTDAQIVGLAGSKITGSVPNADNALNAGTANNALNLGGVGASNYLLKSGGTVTGSLSVTGVISGDGSGLTNLPNTGFSWQSVAGASVLGQGNRGYLFNNTGLVTATLPTNPAVGDTFRVTNANSGGIRIAQNAGQVIIRERGYNYYTAGLQTTLAPPNHTALALAISADGSKAAAFFTFTTGGPTTFPPPPPPAGIYTTADFGRTWTARDPNARDYSGAASSADGTRLVATVNGGQIYTSTDSGVTWTARETNRAWSAVASSADGTKLVAVVNGGQIYTSTDSGATWTPRETARAWSAVASSANGAILAATDKPGRIYVSNDSGATWSPRDLPLIPGAALDWVSISMSDDGSKILARNTSFSIGRALALSTDSGATFSPYLSPLTDDPIRGSDISGDGTVIAHQRIHQTLANIRYLRFELPSGTVDNTTLGTTVISQLELSNDGSRFYTRIGNTIRVPSYTSPQNSTVGTAGGLNMAGDVTSVELQFVGNGEWVVLSSNGTLTVN